MRNQVKTILVSLSAVLVLVAGTVVGTNLVTADTAPSPAVTVTFNYNGATGGNSVTTATVTPGSQADDFLPLPTKPGESFTGWFNTQSLLNGQRITTIEESDAGTLIAGFIPPELAQTLNLALPPSCANGLGTCVRDDIGPGGGLVFLISGSTAYEMAPKTWSGGISDPTNTWSGALQAAADYRGGAKTDWFLPSRDQLNVMYGYRGSVTPDYAYSSRFWSATEKNASRAWQQTLSGNSHSQQDSHKTTLYQVRPNRSFSSP